MVSDVAPVTDEELRRPWARGRRRLSMIRDLALGAESHPELGKRYGVSRRAIGMFAQAYRQEIAETRAAIEDEFHGLWIAQKYARIAELQQDVDDINEVLARCFDPALLAPKHRAMRQAAEELGQLVNKVDMTASGRVSVNYTIEGVNLDDLR